MGNSFLHKIYVGIKLISDWTDKIATVLGVMLVASMTFSIILQVFFRYVVRAALPWPEELSRFLMVWCAFVGASTALKRGDHVGVTFFVEHTPRMINRLITFLTQFVVVYFLFILVKHSWRIAKLGWRSKSGAMLLPMFYPRVGVTVGAVMMFIQLIEIMFRGIIGVGQDQESETMAKTHIA
jgi:TRAP-type C4-dicarboxylate transport system permease small subunit